MAIKIFPNPGPFNEFRLAEGLTELSDGECLRVYADALTRYRISHPSDVPEISLGQRELNLREDIAHDLVEIPEAA